MLLSQSLETLYSRLTSHGDCAEDINTPKGDIEKDLLRVLSYQAESVSSDCLACAVTMKPKLYAYIYSLREFRGSSSSFFKVTQIYLPFFPKFKLYCVCILYRQFLKSNIRRQCHAYSDVKKCFSVSPKRWSNCCFTACLVVLLVYSDFREILKMLTIKRK